MGKGTVEGFQLSPQQKHVWRLQQADNKSPYRTQSAILIEGDLDAMLLRAALEDVFNRHEILRTTLQSLPGMSLPVQVIADDSPLEVGEIDLSDASLQDQVVKVDALFQELGQQPFDFQRGPLLHISLVRLSPQKHILLMVGSVLCADAVTLKNLVGEMARSYASKSYHQEPSEELMQYADFAQWQCEILEAEETKAGRQFWDNKNISDWLDVGLPFERRTGGKNAFEPRLLTIVVDSDLAARIEALARQYETSIPLFLLSAWVVLLWRLTGRSHLVIGTTCDGRKYSEMEASLGLYSRCLPLLYEPEDGATFDEVLSQVRQSANEVYGWQECFSWEQVTKSQDGEKEEPFSALSFDFGMQPVNHTASGVSFSLFKQYSCTDRYKIKLCCVESDARLAAEFHWDADLYRPEDIERLAEQFCTLLESASAGPGTRITELQIMGSDQRRQLLVEFNDTVDDYNFDRCIHEVIRDQVELSPDDIAVVSENQQLTYRALDLRANQLAAHLRKLGVQPDALVGLCVERSLDMVVGILGILQAGGAYVPLDPTYPSERLALMLEDAQVSALVTQQPLLDRLQLTDLVSRHGNSSPPAIICLDEDWGPVAEGVGDLLTSRAASDNLSYLIYTSGSMGRPKGVMVTHRNLTHSTLARTRYYREPITGFLLLSSFAFDSSIVGIFGTLCRGGALIVPPDGLRSDVKEIIKLIALHNVSHMLSLPSLYSLILEQAQPTQLASLRAVIVAGEACPKSLVEKHHALLPRAALFNEYGPTEATVWSSVYECQPDDLAARVPIGRPISNTQIYLLDSCLQPVPITVEGEVYIGGAGITRGYFNQPAATAEKFIPNPISREPGTRLYKTGDLASYLADGDIDFIGRSDHQVKVRGYRIELGEIEAKLNEHPALWEAVVVAREDVPGEKRLVAYVVAAHQPAPKIDELRRFLRETLPDYMIPSAFVPLTALPLTPNGKVDRRALPSPEVAGLEREEEFVSPRTPIEEVVAGSWAEVLGLEEVSVNDNFFELSGHSLNTTQVISRLSNAFQVDLPLRSLFEAPTVSGLAERVEAALRSRQGVVAPPIETIPRNENLALSFAQERLWFLYQYEPKNIAYNVPYITRLTGPLRLGALEQSCNEVIRRHEDLRTTFLAVDGRPVQVITAALNLTLPIVDLGNFTETEWEGLARSLASKDARRYFDLEQGPLLRFILVRLTEEEHILLLTMHHIISDGWSMGVLVRELAALYDAFSNQLPSPLPELPIQYADYAHWQRQWLRSEVLDTQLSYWKQRLGTTPTLLELPTDRPRPTAQTFQGAVYSFLLPTSLTAAIKSLSRQQGVTLFMTLLSTFQTLLSRYTGQDDILVGSLIANRNQPEIEDLIGFFVNTLILRTDLSGDPSCRELLTRVREVTLGAYAHQDLPFEQLVDSLQLERNLARSPLFEVMFILQNVPLPRLELSGLTLNLLEAHNNTAKFDLTLSMTDSEQGLVGSLEYNTDLFDRTTVERMASHFQTLVGSIISDPDQPLSELSLLTQAEQQQLLIEWNDSQTDYSNQDCIHELIKRRAELTPDAVAVEFEGNQVSYEELNERVSQVAQRLSDLGVTVESIVGLYAERSIEMVIGMLGILKAGGAYLPLDPDYPAERLSFMMSDAKVRVVLTQQHLLSAWMQDQAHLICLDGDWHAAAQRKPKSNTVSSLSPGNLAYVIYTSGSTGEPKGVMNTHEALRNQMLWMLQVYGLNESDIVLQKTPFSFDVSLWEFFLPLMVGGRIVMSRPQGHRDNAYLVELIKQRAVTIAHFVPSMLDVFVEEAEQNKCESLARVICSGEALLYEMQERYFTRMDKGLDNLYGPTEAAIHATMWRCNQGDGARGVPIGRPVANTQMYVMDGGLRSVSLGAKGEAHIGGVQLARGYINRADLTAEKFIPNPFSKEPGARLYKTGDLARYRTDAAIEYLGRIDHQVKVRGYRIELGEIEAVLALHSGVREASVLAREEEHGAKQLVAYVVASQQGALIAEELSDYLKKRLPEYMVPAVYVMMDSLPLTTSGKVDRLALPTPDRSASAREAKFVAPRTEAEERLAEIWTQVLGLERVSIHDNFFKLGGDSILSIQIISRAKQAGYHLTPKDMFQHQTIARLATVVDAGQIIKAEQGALKGQAPLTPAQRWFFEQDFASPSHWNQAVLLEVRQALSAPLLEKVLRHLLRHHDALRLRFVGGDSGWQQVYAEPDDIVPLVQIDLSALPEVEQTAALESASASLQASLELSKGPLLRVALFNLGDRKTDRLLIVIHHLVFDGISWRILFEDLQTAYQQLNRGEKLALPPKTTSYRQWAEGLEEHARTAAVLQEMSYWLADPRRRVEGLPVDYPYGPNSEASARTVLVSLDEKETDALLRQVPQAYLTQINDVLLTALALAFAKWTGSNRLLIDLEGHGREDLFAWADLSRTVGWFTAIFPLLLKLEGDAEPGTALKRIKEQVRGVPQAGLGYGLLRYLRGSDEIAEKLRALPQAEVSFNYLGQFDQVLSGSPLFGLAEDSSGPSISAQAGRRYLLDITGRVTDKRLQLAWKYSKNIHSRETVEELAQDFIAALRALIAHCLADDAGGYTPSDFPEADLSQEEIDDLLTEYGQSVE